MLRFLKKVFFNNTPSFKGFSLIEMVIGILIITILTNINSKISNIDDIIAVDIEARNIAHGFISRGGF